ncbi:retrovirus-related pol polyprotein from transposon TNT 1-94 [Tanacetum coccineum]
MASTSPICLMARDTSTKSWLWHQRLSHLNFDTVNDLAKTNLVTALPKFKYHKEHRCPSCEQGKSKRASHPPKPVLNSKQRLHLLHIDLCGPMRIVSINGKRYTLVIVDDYSRYTWVHGNRYSRTGQKQSHKRQNQARNGKDKVKSKQKSVKVRKPTPTKSKVNPMKKIQLEGLKLPNLKLYYKS